MIQALDDDKSHVYRKRDQANLPVQLSVGKRKLSDSIQTQSKPASSSTGQWQLDSWARNWVGGFSVGTEGREKVRKMKSYEQPGRKGLAQVCVGLCRRATGPRNFCGAFLDTKAVCNVRSAGMFVLIAY